MQQERAPQIRNWPKVGHPSQKKAAGIGIVHINQNIMKGERVESSAKIYRGCKLGVTTEGSYGSVYDPRLIIRGNYTGGP